MNANDRHQTETPRPPDAGCSTVGVLCDNVGGAVAAFGWIAGIVLAVGPWKWLAIFVPPYAIYLFIERILLLSGFIRIPWQGK